MFKDSITGFWGNGSADGDLAERMAARITTRGPDNADVWTDANDGVPVAHRRLAIIDLSPAGQQPMHSPCGRYVLVYNGEIYNHRALRADLEAEGAGFDWQGYSDTETLLAGLRHWGAEGALKRVKGMFAFALWDRKARCLTLARDRMGEKPLYYRKAGGTFLFLIRAKGPRRPSGLDGCNRSRCVGGIHARWECARPALHLSGHSQAAARALCGGQRCWPAD